MSEQPAHVVAVALVPVALDDPEETAAFFACFEAYQRELDAFDPLGPDTHALEAYRRSLLSGEDGHELLWVEAGAERAGFLVVRVLEDWPDTTRRVLEISESYVLPETRRHGLARAAVEVLLAQRRAQGIQLAEAAVLRGNEGALAFWERLGFEVRALQTVRRL